jgi:hypothetical protein
MNQHSVTDFESELISIGVTIREFRKPNGTVSEVIGTIGNVVYKWNSFGHCFTGGSKIPAPQYNLKFENSIQITDDQRTITKGATLHKFRRVFFNFSKACSKCSLVKPCTTTPRSRFSIPMPCRC